MSRVMSNLLDNAIRHTPDGGNIVVFSWPHTASRTLLVGVKGSGNGIPEEYHHTVFERFAQLPQTPNGGWTDSCGLGLAFCRIAVEAHGGRIWVASNGEEPGATFGLEIPL